MKCQLPKAQMIGSSKGGGRRQICAGIVVQKQRTASRGACQLALLTSPPFKRILFSPMPLNDDDAPHYFWRKHFRNADASDIDHLPEFRHKLSLARRLFRGSIIS